MTDTEIVSQDVTTGQTTPDQPQVVQEQPTPTDIVPPSQAPAPAPVDPIATVETNRGRPSSFMQALGAPTSLSMENRGFKGYGSRDMIPPSEWVQTLRENQNDPNVIAAFEYKAGPGSAQRYLNVPSPEHLQRYMLVKDNPDARAAFDGLYGGVSKPWAVLLDPKSTQGEKTLAATFLSRIYNNGFDTETSLQYSGNKGAELLAGLATGPATGVQELLQSARIIDKDIIGDTQPRDNPITYGLTKGLSQFATARVVIGSLLRPFTGASDLRSFAGMVREVSLDSISTAFGFDPKDPLLGDTVKGLGWDQTTIPVLKQLNEFVAKADTIENFESEWSQRTARAVENGILAAPIIAATKLVAYGWLAAKAKREGRIADAKAFKDAMESHAQAMDENFSEKAVQQELPFGGRSDPDSGFREQYTQQPGLFGDLPTQEAPKPVDQLPPRSTYRDANGDVRPLVEQVEPAVAPQDVNPELFARTTELDAAIAAKRQSIETSTSTIEKMTRELPDASVVESKLEVLRNKLDATPERSGAARRKIEAQIKELEQAPEFKAREALQAEREAQQQARLDLVRLQSQRGRLGPEVNVSTQEARAQSVERGPQRGSLEPRETPAQIEERTIKLSEETQGELDLQQPNQRNAYDGQGSLFDMPTQERPTAPDTPTPHSNNENAPKPESPLDRALAGKSDSDVIADAVADPKVRTAVDMGIGNPIPRAVQGDSTLLDFIRSAPKMVGRTLAEVRETLGPLLDEFSKVVTADRVEALRVMGGALTRDEIQAFSNMLKGATENARIQRQVLRGQVADLIAKGEGAAADALQRTSLKEAEALYKKLSKLNDPMGSWASDVLNQRRAFLQAIGDEKIQARIGQLEREGLTPNQISSVLELEADNAPKVNTKPLRNAQEDLAAAQATNNPKKIAKAEEALAKAEAELGEQRVSALKERFDTVMGMLVEASLGAKLSGIKTWLVVQNVGIGFNMLSRYMFENMGMLLRGDMAGIARTNAARLMAFRANNQTAVRTIIDFTKDSAVAALNDAPLVTKTESGMTVGKRVGPSITSENMGTLVPQIVKDAPLIGSNSYFGKGLSFAVDASGHLIRTGGKAMGFSDNMFGSFVARNEVGAQAGMDWHMAVKQREAEIRAILKDRNLDPTRRAELKSELASFKNKDTAKVDFEGESLTMKEAVEKRYNDKFDADGRLIDKTEMRLVDEVLLKDAFTGRFGRSLEYIMSSDIMRLTLTPFVRQPLRGIQRGLEMIPAVHWLQPSFRADLQGANGIRRQNIAVSKALTGAALTIWAWDKITSGEMTGPGPSNYADRKEWEKTGWKANHIYWNGAWRDYSSLDQLAPMFQALSAIHTTFTLSDLRAKDTESAMEKATQVPMLLAASIAMSLVDKPGFSAVKDLASGLDGLIRAEKEDAEKTSQSLERGLGRWSTGMYPAFFRSINNALDPSLVEPVTMAQHWAAALGNKDEVPKAYDLLGRPLVNLNPEAGFFGIFSGIEPKDASMEDRVARKLAEHGTLIGSRFAISPTAPDPEMKGVDLRRVPSSVIKGTLWDHYVTEYNSIKIGGNTLATELNNLFNEHDSPTGYARQARGQYSKDGPFAEAIADTVQRYRQAAWDVVRAREASKMNLNMNDEIAKNRKIELWSSDPNKDKQFPQKFAPTLFKE